MSSDPKDWGTVIEAGAPRVLVGVATVESVGIALPEQSEISIAALGGKEGGEPKCYIGTQALPLPWGKIWNKREMSRTPSNVLVAMSDGKGEQFSVGCGVYPETGTAFCTRTHRKDGKEEFDAKVLARRIDSEVFELSIKGDTYTYRVDLKAGPCVE